MDVKNLGDVATFVNTGFDECEVPVPPPVPPEDETKGRKNNNSEKYAHDNPSDSTLGNFRARGWAVKGAIGDPGMCHKM